MRSTRHILARNAVSHAEFELSEKEMKDYLAIIDDIVDGELCAKELHIIKQIHDMRYQKPAPTVFEVAFNTAIDSILASLNSDTIQNIKNV